MPRMEFRLSKSRVNLTRHCVATALAAGSVGLLVAALVTGTAGSADAADAKVNLGTAKSFAVLAGSTVTNTGPSVISGNIGLSPGTSITGFPPGVVINGIRHIADAVALTAKRDLVTGYNDAAGRPTAADVTGKNLGGMTLTPGVYEASTAMALTGTLTLNAQGNSAAVFIFKAGSTLVTATDSKVRLVNGGSPCNVFWQVGSSATLGSTTQFVGTILAMTSASLGTSATVEGRVLARNGAVTLDTNVITAPGCSTTTATASPTDTVTDASTIESTPGTPGVADTGSPTPSDSPDGRKPKIPVIPKGHPDTGLGGSHRGSDGALLLLAGLSGGAAAVTGTLGLRRTAKRRR